MSTTITRNVNDDHDGDIANVEYIFADCDDGDEYGDTVILMMSKTTIIKMVLMIILMLSLMPMIMMTTRTLLLITIISRMKLTMITMPMSRLLLINICCR